MTLHIAHNHVEEMLAGYELENDDTLKAVARKSPTVVETLAVARQKIREFFGPDASARLSVKPDPEIPGYEPIVVDIAVPGDVANALKRTEQFDLGWWLEVWPKETAEICFLALPQ